MRNRSEDQITLVLIRHGATKSNKEHRYLGKTDEELCPEGRTELQKHREMQRYPAVEQIFVSPMKRCIQTAEIVYPGIPFFSVEEWTEMDFGAFEGKNYRELQKDQRYQDWIDSGGTLPFPGGESREDFILRCKQGFCRMLEELKKQHGSREQKAIGLVVHGGTIMALLSSFVGGEYFDYQVATGKGYLCTVKQVDGRPQMAVIRKIE